MGESELGSVWRVLLALGFSALALSCKTNHDCRSSTLFVRTDIDPSFGNADVLEVTLKRDGRPDTTLPPFARAPGARQESFEISFANYAPNSSVTVDVTAKAQGQVVASGEKMLTLLAGCTATDIHLDGTGVIQGSPGAPTDVVAVAKPGGIFELSWTAPTDEGSSPISGYAIDSTPPGLSATNTTLSYTTAPLTIGTSYTFDVRATNSVGPGPAATSNAVVAGDVPAAPTDIVATTDSGRLKATWTAANANGYPVISYTVVANPGGASMQVDGSTMTVTFNAVNSGTMYTLTVTATNALGTGPGGQSNVVTAFCAPNSYDLYALDSATVQYGTPPLAAPDGDIEARRDPSVYNVDYRGYAKFSMGSIPVWAKVTQMRLTLEAALVNGGTAPTPLLVIWYSKDDGWNRAQIPTPNEVEATVAVTGQFPSGAVGKQNFDINIGTHDWSVDVADRYITLGIQNVNANYSYNLYYGSDDAATAPTLNVGVCE